MKKMILITLSFSLFIQNSIASCDNLLRFIVQDRLGKHTINLYGEKAHKLYKRKIRVLTSIAALLGPKELMYSKKTYLQDIRFRRLLEEGQLNNQYIEALTIMRDTMHDYKIIQDWAQNLHQDIAVEIYTEGTHSDRSYYYLNHKVPKRTVLLVLLERLESIGFTYGAKEITKQISQKEFGEILANKKLILDSHFENSTHGGLIHLLQLDLVAYALMKSKINPKILVELYEWMGRGVEIPLKDSSNSFNSLEDGWFALFDSFETDLTSPDVLNPILRAYFDWVTI